MTTAIPTFMVCCYQPGTIVVHVIVVRIIRGGNHTICLRIQCSSATSTQINNNI